jgi:hypothetical protein
MIGHCIQKQISWLMARGFVLCIGFTTPATGKTGGIQVRVDEEGGGQDYAASPSPFRRIVQERHKAHLNQTDL